MSKLLLLILTAFLFISCSKTTPATTPVITDTTIIPSLSHPVPMDTVNDWVRIGRIAYGLEDIWSLSNGDIIIVNDTLLLVSHNNGSSWGQIPGTTRPFLFNLQFLDEQNGFVQGNNTVGVTADGGNTWVFKGVNATSAVYFQFVNTTTGFYDDVNTGLFKTYDAGSHWTSIFTPTQKNFPFYFLDSLMGFSMNGGDFYKSSDGGLNWAKIASGVTTYGTGYFKMQFTDSLTGFSATHSGLLKTSDGGKNWTNCLPASSAFMIPYFLDASNGYCIETNTIYKTVNGGSSWTVSCKLTTDRFSGFHFTDINTGWACTFGGYVLRLK